MVREDLGVMALVDWLTAVEEWVADWLTTVEEWVADWLTTIEERVADWLTTVEERVVDTMFSIVDDLDGFNTDVVSSLVGDCGTAEVVSIEVLEVDIAADTDAGAAEVGSNPKKQTEEALQNRDQRKNGDLLCDYEL